MVDFQFSRIKKTRRFFFLSPYPLNNVLSTITLLLPRQELSIIYEQTIVTQEARGSLIEGKEGQMSLHGRWSSLHGLHARWKTTGPIPEETEAVLSVPAPTDISEVKFYLGMLKLIMMVVSGRTCPQCWSCSINSCRRETTDGHGLHNLIRHFGRPKRCCARLKFWSSMIHQNRLLWLVTHLVIVAMLSHLSESGA